VMYDEDPSHDLILLRIGQYRRIRGSPDSAE